MGRKSIYLALLICMGAVTATVASTESSPRAAIPLPVGGVYGVPYLLSGWPGQGNVRHVGATDGTAWSSSTRQPAGTAESTDLELLPPIRGQLTGNDPANSVRPGTGTRALFPPPPQPAPSILPDGHRWPDRQEVPIAGNAPSWQFGPAWVASDSAAQNYGICPPTQADFGSPWPAGFARPIATDCGPVATVFPIGFNPLMQDPLVGSGGSDPFPNRFAARFGWWGTSNDGNPAQVGEFQSLAPSPFLDVDRLWSDGMRTADFFGTRLGADESQAGLRYIGPSLSSRLFYQDYPHRLLGNPLSGFIPFDLQPPDPLPPAPNNFRVMKEDLNVGQDYAIRVQELRTNFKGKLANNVDWRLNVWSLRKEGERQTNAMAHCFTASNATDSSGNPVTGISCHVLSQSQHIDWVTTEFEPAVEGHFGPATVEYSRTMRQFSANDQTVTRLYDNFGFTGEQPYAVVPDNYTAIDRIKIGANLSADSKAYAYLFSGNTENRSRDTNRRFHGYDLQITDRPFSGVSVTGYAKQYVQTGQLPGTLIDLETANSILEPINYDRQWAGIKGRWLPFMGDDSWRRGLNFSGGYEYLNLDRENALFQEQALTVDESSTIVNSLRLRMSMKWNRQLDSFVKYRLALTNDPLFGVPVRNTATNTSLPTQEHLVELGTTWAPVDTFLISGSLGINKALHDSDVANFNEDSYPIVLTTWYSPTARWTVSGGLAFFSNWIDQDITLGSKSGPLSLPAVYGGRSDVMNIGTTYARTQRLRLSASYEFIRGSDVFALPDPYADVGPLSSVVAEISRFMAGLDYELRPQINCYLRYQYFDFDDRAQDIASGTSSWILGGLTAVL